VIEITIATLRVRVGFLSWQAAWLCRRPDRLEAPMRKNMSFAIAATIVGLAMIFWAKSSVEATSADIARPKAGMSAHLGAPAYLPIQVFEPVY
jgi:hypothetical protein